MLDYMTIPTITVGNFKKVFEDDLYYAEKFENKNILNELTVNDYNTLNYYGTVCNYHGVENDHRRSQDIFKVFWNVHHLINEYLFGGFNGNTVEELSHVRNVIDKLIDTNEEKDPIRLFENLTGLNGLYEFEVLDSGLIVMFSPHNLKQF